MARTVSNRRSLLKVLTGLSLLILIMPIASANAKPLFIFACEPEWASLAQSIGGDQVKVYSATSAMQDPHYIQARPSLLAKVRKADLLFCAGAELEVGWLPLLLRKAKSSVQVGQPGYLMAAEQIDNKLEVPEVLDRSMGDVHSAGNPHVHLNPEHVLTIAQALANRLVQIAPERAEHFNQGLLQFQQRWQQSILIWQKQAEPLKGKKVMVYHKNFSYMLDWLSIDLVGDLEPLPGIPPTSKHLADLLALQQQTPADVLLYAPYQNEDPVDWFVKKTAIKAIKMPYTVGGSEQAADLFSLYQQQINLLLEAMKESS